MVSSDPQIKIVRDDWDGSNAMWKTSGIRVWGFGRIGSISIERRECKRSPAMYVLFESASGYALFEAGESEDIGIELPAVQAAITDLSKFGKIVKLKAFLPFKTAQHALENINSISEGIMHDHLKSFIEMNLPKVKSVKKAKYVLGVSEAKLGNVIQEELNVPCKSGEVITELLRGIRLYFAKFIKALKESDFSKAQLGLGHSYSRCKVKFNVNRVDNMIIQAIAILDQLDKDVNLFSMRLREWYSYHFPELVKIVNENLTFAKVAKYISDRKTLSEKKVEDLEEICQDASKAKQIFDAARSSMGMDIAELDLKNIHSFANRVIALTDYRAKLHEYLTNKMNNVAPNLGALIGEMVGARLISHAGSLTNLAKYPASTVQILGAEKALFRALKTKGNTPKYGLIFHSTFIGKAGQKNKGRISRYLANKCSIASRIDCFNDAPTDKFGTIMKEQVEERLRFYETGDAPRKNIDCMQSVIEDLNDGEVAEVSPKKEEKKEKKKDKKKKDKKRKADDSADESPSKKAKEEPSSDKKKDKKKKKKKNKE
eukprot:Nk52_evm19s245 gene=Nk52_evmTU19s245